MTKPRSKTAAKAPTQRQLRVSEEIRHVLSSLFMRGEFRDPDLADARVTVTEGLVKRGSGVRLLCDGVVIHNGELSQLKRFKDDVREVARGYECGLSFAGFNDLQEGDMVESFEIEMVPG